MQYFCLFLPRVTAAFKTFFGHFPDGESRQQLFIPATTQRVVQFLIPIFNDLAYKVNVIRLKRFSSASTKVVPAPFRYAHDLRIRNSKGSTDYNNNRRHRDVLFLWYVNLGKCHYGLTESFTVHVNGPETLITRTRIDLDGFLLSHCGSHRITHGACKGWKELGSASVNCCTILCIRVHRYRAFAGRRRAELIRKFVDSKMLKGLSAVPV